jgi:redox-sensitive bicupin YhaK (pirin superfamily)
MKTNPTLTLRRSAERGHANHGWLDSYHTFSFADYYDPAHMGFRSLRVINDDQIAAGGGFPSHPHRDMEIFSYLLGGKLAHQDSMGNKRVLEPGQVQLMSAGTGVLHSEFNPSTTEKAHLLQIWITPRQRGLTPGYTEWQPAPGSENEAKVLVISPDGRENSAIIHQDVDVWRVRLQPGESITHSLPQGHGLWLHVAKGAGSLNGTVLSAGDAASAEDEGEFTITATDEPLEALLFDIA